MTANNEPHVLAVSAGPPWIEPPFAARRVPRDAALHGGPYDGLTFPLYSLGQVLSVGGTFGRVVYEHKEHDDDTATYTSGEAA